MRNSSPSQNEAEGIARNTAFSFAVQLATSIFTAALTIFLVRALEPEGYGLFALALAVGGLLAVPSDLGVTNAAARFLAECRADRREAAAVMSDALVLKVLASALTSGALFALAGPIAAAYGEDGLVWPLRGIAISLFGHSMMTLVRGVFVSLARISANFRLVLSESAVETAATVGLVLLGMGATGAAFGRAIGYAFGAALGLVMVARALGRRALDARRARRAGVRRVAGYAGALAVVDGAFTLFGNLDAILLGAFLSASSVGLYKAPARFVVFLGYPGLALANAVAPRMARSPGEAPNVAAFVLAARYLIVFQAAVAAPLLVWAGPIVHLLLGPKYAASADVLRALAPAIFLTGLAPLVSLTANYLGEARRRIPIAIATVVVDAVVAVILIPRIGMVGAAVATDVAFAVYVPAHIWICRRFVDLPVRPLLATLARSLAAAGAMGALLFAVGTSGLSVADWLIGSVAGTAAFAAVLLVGREFKPAEVLALRGALGRVRASPG